MYQVVHASNGAVISDIPTPRLVQAWEEHPNAVHKCKVDGKVVYLADGSEPARLEFSTVVFARVRVAR